MLGMAGNVHTKARAPSPYYVFSHESGSEYSFFRPAHGCGSRPGRSSHVHSGLAGGDAKNFAED